MTQHHLLFIEVFPNQKWKISCLEKGKVLSLPSIDQWGDNLPKEIRKKNYSILIFGSSITSRAVDNGEEIQSQVVLGANPEDFYFSEEPIDSSKILIHFMRKDVMSTLVHKLEKFPSFYFTRLIVLDSQSPLTRYGEFLGFIRSSENTKNAPFDSKIETTAFSQKALVELNALEQQHTDFLQKRYKGFILFRFCKKVLVPCILVLQLLFGITYFYLEQTYLDQQLASSSIQSDFNQLKEIQEENSNKVELLNELGLNRKKSITFYLDQLAEVKYMLKTEEFEFHKIDFFNPKDSMSYPKLNQIQIIGQMKRPVDLTNYIEILEKKEWVNSCVIEQINRESEQQINAFILTIVHE